MNYSNRNPTAAVVGYSFAIAPDAFLPSLPINGLRSHFACECPWHGMLMITPGLSESSSCEGVSPATDRAILVQYGRNNLPVQKG
ncbi:MAG TPA: hypothetical protein V6C91_20350 [Coleofasciculaceae cyanobacterium]